MDIHEYRVRQREFAPRGEQLPQSKLTAEKVREARRLYERARLAKAHLDAHYSVAGLARRFGVSTGAMEKALNRSTWGHVR